MMRVLLQRVSQAEVRIEGKTVASIGSGLLVFVGICSQDTQANVIWLCKKISQLRVFEDNTGVMNLSLLDTGGELLAVSQFTLFASTRKGNRPSYSAAAAPDVARPLFDAFVNEMAKVLAKPVPCGVFGADMAVDLINQGPVTLWLDSAVRE